MVVASRTPSKPPPGWRAGLGAVLKQREESLWVLFAGALGLVAGGIHLAWSPHHFDEAAGQGIFFVTLGAAQILWAVWFLARTSWLSYAFGVAITTGSILVYFLTLVIRAPFASEPEVLDYGALSTKVIEAATLVLLLLAPLVPDYDVRWTKGKAVLVFLVFLGAGLILGGAAIGAGYAMEPIAPGLKDPSSHHHDEGNETGHTHAAFAGKGPVASRVVVVGAVVGAAVRAAEG